MSVPQSDALVFFGATGDLAYKKIFPALQAMVKHGHLDVPVIGVAKAGWDLDRFKARARDSLEQHGGVDEAAFAKLCGLLRYVDGDYQDPATFEALRKELGAAQHPAHYLAIPPVTVRDGRRATRASRAAPEAPGSSSRSRSAATSSRRRRSTRSCSSNFDESSIFRIDHYLGQAAGAEPALLPLRQLVPRADLEPPPRRERADHDGRSTSGSRAAGPSTTRPATIRDVVQNHLLQVLANLAMEPPVGTDSESIRDEKVKVLKAIPPLDPRNVVRGQFRGYRDEKGVSPDSQVETFAAVRLEIDSWRWQGVPFYIRAGKMPARHVHRGARQTPPATDALFLLPTGPNYFRFRISPEASIAIGAMVMGSGEEMAGEPVELLASHHADADEMDAYERLLGEAMKGDATLFAREDYVEEAWRIVEPVLGSATPMHEYEPNTWGPSQADRIITDAGGWHDPVMP